MAGPGQKNLIVSYYSLYALQSGVIIVAISFIRPVNADTVTTKDGSVLNGTITLIDKGVIHIITPYAGKLKIKQESVLSFKTESPLVVRLKNGITIPGKITPAGDNMLKIQMNDNIIGTNTVDIKTSWTPDKADPKIERNNRRKWKNNFAFNLNGRSGNVDRFYFGTELNLRLKGPNDELYFGFEYELSYAPSLSDLANYNATHDSSRRKTRYTLPHTVNL